MERSPRWASTKSPPPTPAPRSAAPAICKPTPSSTIPRSAEHIELSGYAYSGGGRDIARVEVSTDGGNTWQLATMPTAIPTVP